MQNGTRPTYLKHKDYDFLKSHNLGGVTLGDVTFPDEFFADAGLTMPDQNAIDYEFTPPTPAMPEGCTNFAQADIATDLDGQIHSPNTLEAITHANKRGGIPIREALNAAVSLGWFKQYFNIRLGGRLDAFDTFRLAQIAGVNVGEKRAITWGTPWFDSWEAAIRRGEKVMPMPSQSEIGLAQSLPWHNSVLDGWSGSNYRDKSWQGDKGFVEFPRAVINAVMAIPGTAAFTPTNKPVFMPQTIDISSLQWMISVLRDILSRYI